jgi:hypothetical protein
MYMRGSDDESMNWNPPFSAGLTTLLILLALAAMAASFAWSRKQLNVATPAGLISVALRIVAFLLLLFFLLQPTRLPPPDKVPVHRTLAILIDTSGSMSRKGTPDGPTRFAQVRKLLSDHKLFDRVREAAQGDVPFVLYGFDSQVAEIKLGALADIETAGKQTDLAAAMERAVKLNQNRNLMALLVLSDGRNTQGADPRLAAEKLGVPVYTVAVGDEPREGGATEKKLADLSVDSVSADPRIIVGRTAQVVVSVSGANQPARQVNVELLENDKVINTTAVAISPQQSKRQALFAVRPTGVGVHKYTVRVPLEENESDPTNNTSGFSVEVVDAVNRLVYLDRLRDERRFLKPLLEATRGLRYTAIVQQDEQRTLVDGNDKAMKKEAGNLSPEQLAGIKAVILGDLPATALPPQQIASLVDWVDKGGSLLLLAGPQSMGEKGFVTTDLAKVLPVEVKPGAPYLEREFKVELTPEGAAHPAFQRVKMRWDRAAPLLSRFDTGEARPAATTLLATTDGRPMVVSQTFGHGRVAIVLTDSTWRWQLGFDASRPGAVSEHQIFWRQMIDWLLPDMGEAADDTREVQLIADRVEYQINDRVVLMASVRGADGSLIKDAKLEITIASPDGRPIRREAVLDPAAQSAFTATFEAPFEGEYEAQVIARQGEQTIGSDRITIRVTQPVIEYANTNPDRPLLREIAQRSGGQYLEPSELDKITELVELRPYETTRARNETEAVPAWDRWWFALIFLGLMAGEWLVRKKNQWV